MRGAEPLNKLELFDTVRCAMQSKQSKMTRVNWRQVLIFLGITFGLTFALNLLLYQTQSFGQNVGTGLALQLQMLIPATIAIALQLFLFRGSRIYHLEERPRWFFYFYMVYAAVYAGLAISVLLVSDKTYQTVASVIVQGLSVGGLVFLVILRLLSGKQAFSQVGLSGGKVKYWVIFGATLVFIYLAMAGLNVMFGLGQTVDARIVMHELAGGQATGLEELPDAAFLLVTGLQSVLLAPFLALLIAFGEEYGWRGYLQSELIKLGKVRGILLVGVIWGLWHAPVIAMGYNYPDQPILGIPLMTLYTIALAFFFGFAVLVSGSIWLAAWLHALNNQVISFLNLMVVRVDDPVLGFGIGVYGLMVWALIVGAILLIGRKIWSAPVGPELVESSSEPEVPPAES
jgi:membrane protease YdiL (CAAX protease family)